jgi:serine/threonine protein kinase
VGVMLYECLTGEVPFRAQNYLGVISQVLTKEATPPGRLRPELGIPAAVEMLVMRALDKDRDRRYQQMADLEHDLERVLAGDQNVGLPPVAADASPALVPRRNRWHLGVAAVLVIGGGLAVALDRGERAPGDAPPAAVPRPVAPLAPASIPGRNSVSPTASGSPAENVISASGTPPQKVADAVAATASHPPRPSKRPPLRRRTTSRSPAPAVSRPASRGSPGGSLSGDDGMIPPPSAARDSGK